MDVSVFYVKMWKTTIENKCCFTSKNSNISLKIKHKNIYF